MAGHESNPASLFQLFVDYGRYTEATHLLLEYIESFASVVICIVWFFLKIVYLSDKFVTVYYSIMFFNGCNFATCILISDHFSSCFYEVNCFLLPFPAIQFPFWFCMFYIYSTIKLPWLSHRVHSTFLCFGDFLLVTWRGRWGTGRRGRNFGISRILVQYSSFIMTNSANAMLITEN